MKTKTCIAIVAALSVAGAVLLPGGTIEAANGTSSAEMRAATRTLSQRIKASGRADALLRRTVVDPLTGKPETIQGQLALEPPDRASLRFSSTGERITLRSDGGEWIQPELKQALILGPGQAAAARRWWSILLADPDQAVTVRKLAQSRYLFIAGAVDGAAADTAWVWLDAQGLPKRLEMREDSDSKTVYQLSGWRFSRPKGRNAFVLAPPKDYEVVKLP